MRGLLFRSVAKGVSISKRVYWIMTKTVMKASSKVISAFWLWCIWRNSCRFFYYHFKILSSLFYSNLRCFICNSLSNRTANKLAFSNRDNDFSFHFLSSATLNCNFFLFCLSSQFNFRSLILQGVLVRTHFFAVFFLQ